MTITQLEYVLSLNTFRNFAKAAKNCYVTQPTLSMQVKKLEDELGVILFDRSKKPVLPTELSQYLLPLFLSKFMKKYPTVQLVMEEALSEEIAFKLNNDLLDVGIIVTPMATSYLIESPMFYESFVGYVNEDHPLAKQKEIAVEDLKLDEIWLMKEGHCFRNQMINICGEHVKKETRLKFESGSLNTLMTMVEQQSGYTLLPELAVIDLPTKKAKRIRTFKTPVPKREVSMVSHRSYIKRKLIGLLRDEIMANLPDHVTQRKAERVIKW